MWTIQTHECSTQHSHCTPHTHTHTGQSGTGSQLSWQQGHRAPRRVRSLFCHSQLFSHTHNLPARCVGACEGVCPCLREKLHVCVLWGDGVQFSLSKTVCIHRTWQGRNGAITSAMTQQMGLTLPHLLHRNEYPCMKWKRRQKEREIWRKKLVCH